MSGLNKDLVTEETSEPVRLNKYLSMAGFCSRREADRLIEAGEVKVNGKAAAPGQKVSAGQKVECGGKEIKLKNKFILIAFNKPVGVECTSAKDNPDSIIKYIDYPERIYPIGRLDKDSCGLILLTNTGDLVNKILKAEGGHEKEYLVTVSKPLTKEFLEKMRSGVELKYDEVYRERLKNKDKPNPREGSTVVTKPCRIEATGKCEFKIILTQGLNRQIRRMCAALGFKVISLKRIRIMNIQLGNLPEGHHRNVTESEIRKLLKDLG